MLSYLCTTFATHPPTPPLHIHPCPSPHLPGGIFLLDPATRCWQPSFGAGGVGPTGTGSSVLLPPLHSHYPSHPPPSFPGWFPLDSGARARGGATAAGLVQPFLRALPGPALPGGIRTRDDDNMRTRRPCFLNAVLASNRRSVTYP